MADADASEVVAPETPVTDPQTQPSEEVTAAPQEAESQPSVPAVKNAEEEKLEFARQFHRQELGKLGNSVARVKPDIRQKLAERPTLIEEQQAEIDALRRALAGGQLGPSQQAAAVPEKDEAAERAAKFLKSRGITQAQDNYADLLEYETERERDFDSRINARLEKVKPDTNKLVTEISKAQRNEVWQRELSALKQSPEWNDPVTGPDFLGRFILKYEQLEKTRPWASPNELRDEIRSERAPKKKSASAGKPSLGDTPSGKVAAGAGPDPFDSYREQCRAAGVDPDKLGQT
jgi:hypothetical protein